MVKQTQTICRLLPTNWLNLFEHFVRLALKGFNVKSLHDHFCMMLVEYFMWNDKILLSHWLRISRATAKLKVKFILCEVCHKNSNLNWKVVDIYCWQEKSYPNGMHILLMFTIQGCCVTDYLISAIFFSSIL